uniref:coxsackievirus and adenovirus receptor homolog isoform X2 n=1 Tax=Scatophagus argus TaxID=75038 RepID=UPI001ED8131A|nr:coxsackievirus and adenovirus receptor homolog isoform X2 [Scatophagus argus]
MVPIPRSLFFKMRPQRTHISRFRFWRYCMIVSILLLSLLRSHGLQIHLSSKSPKFAAVGDTAKLSCHFNLHLKDSGVLDIEWRIKPADILREETLVIWYSGDRIYDNYNPFGRRVCFVSPGPASGNASINISNLKMTDTNTYQCKVRKGPAIKSKIIHLNAMERPAKLECYAEDAVELNRKLAFRCRAAKGSPPIWYSWSMKGTRKRLPHDATFDPTRGDLVLTNSKEILSSGTLVCTAHNPVGMKTCLVALRLNSTGGITSAAAAAAAVVTLLMVLIIPTAVIIFRRKRGKKRDYGNEIAEDEPPPRKWLSKKSHRVVSSSTASCARQELKVQMQGNQKQKNSDAADHPRYVEMKDLDVGGAMWDPFKCHQLVRYSRNLSCQDESPAAGTRDFQ